MSTQTSNAVELLIRFAAAADPPTGSVRRADGSEQPFSGWLGLVRLLEDNCPTPAPRRGADHDKEPLMTLTPSIAPISHGPQEGEALWFLGTLVTIKSSAESTGGRVGVTENLAPRGTGSPLHVHRNEDEWFYVIEGELRFWVGEDEIKAPAGSFVYGPKGIPHAFTVTSEMARFLLVTEPAGFEGFVRAIGEPATELTVPPADIAMPDEAHLGAIAAEYGIEVLGPHGIPS